MWLAEFSGCWVVGAAPRGDYVQEEVRPGESGREGGLGHVRRDNVRFAQHLNNRGETPLLPVCFQTRKVCHVT